MQRSNPMKRMRVEVPFSGFYESRWSWIAEIMEEQGCGTGQRLPTTIPASHWNR
jgi:hypothetical protein